MRKIALTSTLAAAMATLIAGCATRPTQDSSVQEKKKEFREAEARGEAVTHEPFKFKVDLPKERMKF